MTFRYINFLFFLIAGVHISPVQAQNLFQKIQKKFISSQKDSLRSGSLMILPVLGYSQESGFEVGGNSTYHFYADRNDASIRTSSVALTGTHTSEKQTNLKLESDIWTKNNDYHFISEIRYRDWPFNYYGIGMDTWKEDESRIKLKLFRVRLEAEKKISHRIYVGANVLYNRYDIKNTESGQFWQNEPIVGKNGGNQLLLGLSQSFDSRNSVIFTTSGLLSRIRLAYSVPVFADKEDFNGWSVDYDLRYFVPVTKKLTLATQGIYRTSLGSVVPFYSYREMGGDMMMRGYYLGRYRDKNYVAAQADIRYRFIPRLGITAFGGLGTTFSNQYAARPVYSLGGGLRYFFSMEHGSSIRIDYAIGEKRSGEQRQSGFYLSLNEAF